MSHFVNIRTQIREATVLVDCLREMGFAEVECHEHAQHLFGYQGDRRHETAEVIVRRRQIGAASNDLGFKRQESGEFQAIISEFDRGQRLTTAWLQQLNQRYARSVILEQARAEDMIVEEQTLANGDLVIVVEER